ncbi:MAG TPA: SpoIID/LytB domain-containing protein, partial [Candidatus Acidoferrales bacterium]|nr:SpoIID/LytB domain-containing protein [Candidatus Acidoferrales bacterium]
WTAGGSTPVDLTYHWYDATGNVVVAWDGVRTPLGGDVAPTVAKTITANVIVPKDPAQYQLRFALVKEGVSWFPPSIPLPVLAQAAYVAQVTANAVPPMIAGGTYTVVANLKNTGAAAWNFAGANPIDVSYHWHDPSGNTVVWDGLRTPLVADVAPGATVTANVKVATPAKGGTYTLTVDLVREGVGWLGGTGGSQPLRQPVTVDTARFAASYGLPPQIDTFWLENKTLQVQLTNTGNQTWSGAGPNPVNLSYHIFDAAGNTVLWDGPRTAIGADVAPGTARAFTIGFTAPATSGVYTLALDLVREGIGWFADGGAPQGRVPFSVTSGLNGGYAATTTPGQVTIGAVVQLSVTVVNYSGRTWPAAGANPVHLGYHIVGANTGTTYVWDGARGTLPKDMAPATQAVVPMTVAVPPSTGDYILEWDLVQEGVAWFSQVNVPMKKEPFTVVSGVVFYGSGFGHGVGLSQYGANGLANGVTGRPYTGEQIIQNYFPGTTFMFGDATRPFNRVLLSQPSSQSRYRCGTNAYFDGYFGDVASNGGFKVLDESSGNAEIGRASVTAKWQFVARNGVVEVWSNNTATPQKIGQYPSVAVVPLDPGFPLRFFQKDHLDGTPGFYRGNLRFSNLGDTLRVVNAVTYDDYTRGVISFEMPNTWHAEALKSQAYAARSYSYASYRGTSRDYDVGDDQSDQCYGGVAAEGPRTDAAVIATAGKIVSWQGQAAKTYFASSSGGYTLEFGCWGTRVVRSTSGSWVCTPDPTQPFLASVPDPADRLVSSPANPRASWSAVFTGAQIVNAVICAGGPNIGTLQGVDTTNSAAGGAGHVISIRFIGTAATADVRAEAVLQSCLGLRSTMVRLAPF